MGGHGQTLHIDPNVSAVCFLRNGDLNEMHTAPRLRNQRRSVHIQKMLVTAAASSRPKGGLSPSMSSPIVERDVDDKSLGPTPFGYQRLPRRVLARREARRAMRVRLASMQQYWFMDEDADEVGRAYRCGQDSGGNVGHGCLQWNLGAHPHLHQWVIIGPGAWSLTVCRFRA